MKILYNNFFLIVTLILLCACSTQRDLFVGYTNSQIDYSGRIDSSKIKGVDLYWSGTSIKLNFEGKSISALFKDETGDNYYNVMIDNDSLSIFRPDTTKQYYQFASKLPEGKHTVEIFKRTEWNRGKSSFYGFHIQGHSKVLPKSLPQKKKIEFYGNSITAGYAVEDTSGRDIPDSTYTNNYLSYAAITARHYNAKYQCICKSGIGMTISWFPLIMPEMYDRLIPTDENSKWDFSLYNPDIVVINIFQNDSWLVNMPGSNEFKKRLGSTVPNDDYFIKSYQQFVENIRKHYPKSKIICILGSMDATKEGSKWVSYIKEAVANLNDNRIYTHFIPYKETSGHPSVKEQEEIAESLIQFIDKNIDW
ncbi:SGNH/GDSL hydrolase family protein [Yeosuana marina]|uniref:SGNH/GDSL hydrolase family protein n=1 Tax=Yeosuana marina TaxID=1565536 RepID=UPI0030C7E7BC